MKGRKSWGIIFLDLFSLSLSFPLLVSFSLATDGLAHLSEDSLMQTCVCPTGWQRSNDIVEGEEPLYSPASLCDAVAKGASCSLTGWDGFKQRVTLFCVQNDGTGCRQRAYDG